MTTIFEQHFLYVLVICTFLQKYVSKSLANLNRVVCLIIFLRVYLKGRFTQEERETESGLGPLSRMAAIPRAGPF